MVKAVSFFKRRSGMSVEAFQAYWLTRHPDVVVRLPGIRRYVQSHTLPGGYRKGEPAYDGIAEVWFDDTGAMRALAGTPAYAAVEADEARFIERATMGLIITEEHVIKGGSAPAGGVKNVEFVTHRPGMAIDAFQRYWREVHGPLAVATEGAGHGRVVAADVGAPVLLRRRLHDLQLDGHREVVEQDREDRDALAHGRLEVHAREADRGVAPDVDAELVRRGELGPH